MRSKDKKSINLSNIKAASSQSIGTLVTHERLKSFIQKDIEKRYSKFCVFPENEIENAYAILRNYIGSLNSFIGSAVRFFKGHPNRSAELVELVQNILNGPAISDSFELIQIIAEEVKKLPPEKRSQLDCYSSFWCRCVYIALRTESLELVTELLAATELSHDERSELWMKNINVP